MNHRWNLFLVLGGMAVGGVIGLGQLRAATSIYLPDRVPAFKDDSVDPLHGAVAAGDFNGDGSMDLAVYRSHRDVRDVNLFFGGAPWNGATFAGGRNLRVLMTDAPHVIPGPHLALGDVNGDGRDDMVFVGSTAPDATPQKLYIVFGTPTPPPMLDLRLGRADVEISGTFQYLVPPVSVGDVTADGVKDLVVVGSSDTFIIRGGTHLVSGLEFDLSDASKTSRLTHFPSTIAPESMRHVIGDVDGDGISDLLLLDSFRQRSGSTVGAVYVFPGQDWPAVRDVTAQPPDLTVLGGSLYWQRISGFSAPAKVGVGGAPALVLRGQGPITSVRLAEGPNAWNQRPLVDMTTAAQTMTGIPSFNLGVPTPDPAVLSGDFDGDGRADLFGHGLRPTGVTDIVNGMLTSRTGTDLLGASIGSESLQIAGSSWIESLVMADFNGDGLSDVAAYVDPYAHTATFPPATYGEVHLIPGFRPLTHPTVAIARKSATTRRVTLSLGVDGDPTELWLEGDVDASMRERWLPYAATLTADWTPAPGAKAVRVKFRNAVGIESDWAEATDVLTVAGAGLTPVTTRVTAGSGGARWDLRLTAPGWVRAAIYGGRGGAVATLYDGEAAAGILSLVWDGLNAAGGRVAPGGYLVRVESPAGREDVGVVVE